MVTTREKVVVYITHDDPVSGVTRLLVFSQPAAPEAGFQVPAGTIRPGEAPAAAALREAWEETGLPGLEFVRRLGEQTVDMRPWGKDERHRRHVYHLRCPGSPPERWLHEEPDPDGLAGPSHHAPIVFALFWAALPDGVPGLVAGQGALLGSLGIACP